MIHSERIKHLNNKPCGDGKLVIYRMQGHPERGLQPGLPGAGLDFIFKIFIIILTYKKPAPIFKSTGDLIIILDK